MYRQTIPNSNQLFNIFILWLMCLPLLSLSIALVKFNLVLPQNAANEGWWLLRRDLRQGLFESRRGMGRAEPHPCGRSCRSHGRTAGRGSNEKLSAFVWFHFGLIFFVCFLSFLLFFVPFFIFRFVLFLFPTFRSATWVAWSTRRAASKPEKSGWKRICWSLPELPSESLSCRFKFWQRPTHSSPTWVVWSLNGVTKPVLT